MKDPIERQDAIDELYELYEYMRVIDPTEAADLVRQGIFLAEKKIENMPSAQPEIVRCKDCLMHGVCRFEQGLGLDGYCSQAERRTDD